ncbi:galactosyl transferase GMA12/MNN10 family protein [Teratosphaeria destructans]|uniref:Galactosyl transferase GMA12/MNN10 family protein n=1 Tax=Teratosphaeria destructans TaxID=418781 RepID=A0A9W7T0Q1_9PEZI|nr:galactosyl transferase GMA12/MNN10 family protein [Teratosphaeria destructans]
MDFFAVLLRRFGSRSLATALFFVAILLYFAYNWNRPSSWSSPAMKGDTKPWPVPEQSAAASHAESLSSLRPTQVDQTPDETPTPSPAMSPEANSATLDRPFCPLIKVSMLYGSHKFSQLEKALESHRRHCERWKCDFISLGQDLTNRRLYSKQYFLMSALLNEMAKPAEERKQWLMWVDADAILINPSISPCAFLPPDNLQNVYALMTADHQGLNAGIFYLRVHSDSLDLLTQTVDYPMVHPDDDLGWFGEQAAMERVIHSIEAQSKTKGTTSGIAWVPRLWFNAYEFEHGFEGQPGHTIVHFAGLAETRLAHMTNWLTELENNQAKWEIPLEKTFYADDITKFWDEYAANMTEVR